MSGISYTEHLRRVKERLKENLNIEDEVIGVYDLDDLNEEKEESEKEVREGMEEKSNGIH